MSLLRIYFLCLIVVSISVTVSDSWNGGSKASRERISRGYYGDGANVIDSTNGPPKQKNISNSRAKAARGSGIGAWGIVAIVIAIFLLGTLIYYAVICYPIICGKEKAYDPVELTAV